MSQGNETLEGEVKAIDATSGGSGSLLLWLNVAIMTLPPIHLLFARGSIWMAMFFFAASSIFLIVSVIYLHRKHSAPGEE
jgi:hypothetical protein